jgi:protein SCO1
MNKSLTKALAAIATLVFVLIVAAVLLLPRAWQGAPQPELATELFDQAIPLPSVNLRDHHGQRFRTSALEGRFSLVFFGFTNCPDVCPLSLQVLADVQKVLADTRPAEAPDIVFISVDQARDTPERIASYVDYFGADILGVTGPDDELEPLLRALGVHVHRQIEQGQQYNVVHNSTVYVVGPQADVVAVFGAAESARTLTQDYLRIRARYLRRFPELRTRVDLALR